MNGHNPCLSIFSFKSWGLFFKWGVAIGACLYLAYKLVAFDQYNMLWVQWKQMPLCQWVWFVAVLVLLPLNWILEAWKWKRLTSRVQKLSLKNSVRGVMAGISTGFFTPNRVGELVGRVLYLDPGNRKTGATLSLVNSLTQNLIMVLCGVPACLVFFLSAEHGIAAGIRGYLIILAVFFLLFGLLYFLLPELSRFLAKTKLASRTVAFTACLSGHTSRGLIGIMLISLGRYVVFCMQFFFMLRFFGVQLHVFEALMAIPANYLFVTFSPSVAFSEAAVRGSYAVFFIGSFSGQVVGIAMAGVCIWFVNFIIPMLFGSFLLLKKKL